MIKKLIFFVTAATVVVLGLIMTNALFRVWPTTWHDEALQIKPTTTQRLALLRQEAKFFPNKELLYFGAPSEAVRVAAELAVNQTIDVVSKATLENPRRSTVLRAIKVQLPTLDTFESEEKDRSLLYIEEILASYEMATSSDLLNVWRYGFPLNWFIARKQSK